MILWIVLLLSSAWRSAWSPTSASCRCVLGVGGTIALLVAFADHELSAHAHDRTAASSALSIMSATGMARL